NVAGRRVGLQLVQELPAVLVRHKDVKRNGQGAEGARLLQTFLTTRCPDHTIARLGEVLAQEVDDIRVVVDGQDDLVRLWWAEALLTRGDGGNACNQWGSVIVQGERHREGRADPKGALHRDIAAQELGEATANRQAEARTTILPGGAAIHLTEFFKDML